MGDATPQVLAPIYEGWADHHSRLVEVLRPLTDEQLQLRPDPEMWAIWQLASNMAGGRAHWFHDVLREGDPAVRDRFRMTSTTVPGLPIEDAGWEDDELRPRSAAELVEALEDTYALIAGCFGRWSEDDLAVEFSRTYAGRTVIVSRAWVIWRLVKHELEHGTEIAVILRANGLPTLEL